MVWKQYTFSRKYVSKFIFLSFLRLFIGKTDAETEASILWPPDAKGQFIGKDPGVGKDWGQEEKGAIEDETVGWLNGHKLEQPLGGSEGQGSLVCGSPWGCKELDTSQQQNKDIYPGKFSALSGLVPFSWKYVEWCLPESSFIRTKRQGCIKSPVATICIPSIYPKVIVPYC